ncbi:hypothetical protein HPB48_012276 [Haemaphysalis longicornis]|uniref:Uncharacterized protein n=1 Tax=Haemaphysalis longicornis TaxID=44386 RepID=A0A9J6FNE4_HAELO|nr:hypothetical protein HPB48_012276 [Haemaphysalis longicornis]
MADSGRSPRQRLENSEAPGLQDARVKRRPQSVVILAITAFLTALLFAAIRGYAAYAAENRPPRIDTTAPFCCPKEAEDMARIVNFSIKPCTDFYAYVCQSGVRGQSVKTTLHADAIRVVTTTMKSEGATRGKAGQFLTAYFKSCLETVSRRERFFSDLASGLFGAMQEVFSTPDSRNAIAFMLTMSLKYELDSWISAIPDTPVYIALEADLGCDFKPYSMEALDALTSALQIMINVTASKQETVGIRKELCTRFADYRSSVLSIYQLDDIFDKDVWSVQEVKAALDMLGYSVTTIGVMNSARAMRGIYSIFASPARGTPNGLRAAYLMWRTLESALGKFLVSSRMSTVVVFDACKESLDKLDDMWNLFYEELYPQTENKRKITSVFAAVKDAVYRDCRASQLFHSEDTQRLENFFGSVSLLLSLQGTDFSAPVPTPDEHFSAIFLQGRAFITELKKNAYYARGDVLDYSPLYYYIDHNVIYFSPYLYKYAVPGESFSSDLLSMAVLGRWMAENLWYIILSEVEWGSKTRDNINLLARCFFVTRTSSNDSYEGFYQGGLPEATHALALASALKTFNRTDWYKEKPAWSLWKLSHAQLFYIFSTFHFCLNAWSEEENMTLKQLRDFAKAFRCPVHAPPGNGSSCIPSLIPTE